MASDSGGPPSACSAEWRPGHAPAIWCCNSGRMHGAGGEHRRPAPRAPRGLRPARQRRGTRRRAPPARASLPLRLAATGAPGCSGGDPRGAGAAAVAPAVARRHAGDPFRAERAAGKVGGAGAAAARQPAPLPRCVCRPRLLAGRPGDRPGRRPLARARGGGARRRRGVAAVSALIARAVALPLRPGRRPIRAAGATCTLAGAARHGLRPEPVVRGLARRHVRYWPSCQSASSYRLCAARPMRHDVGPDAA